MNIAKSIVTVLLFIPYVLLCGTISFSVKFPDNTKVCYEGWLF